LPLRLQRCHVDDNAAARIGGLAQANGQHTTWNPEILHGARQGKGVRRNNAHIALDIDKAVLVEVLRIHRRRAHIGEDLELIAAAHVVAVAGGAVGDHPAFFILLDLTWLERLNHAVFFSHAPNPLIGLNGHLVSSPQPQENLRLITGRPSYPVLFVFAPPAKGYASLFTMISGMGLA